MEIRVGGRAGFPDQGRTQRRSGEVGAVLLAAAARGGGPAKAVTGRGCRTAASPLAAAARDGGRDRLMRFPGHGQHSAAVRSGGHRRAE